MNKTKHKKVTICIPTYWANDTGRPVDDKIINIYDHPTPISSKGSIERVLLSLQDIDADFNVIVIGTITDPDLRSTFQKKLKKLLARFRNLNLFWFSFDELDKFHSLLKSGHNEYQKKYLSLQGYSNIRNLCLILPHLLGSELAVLIDDDEVISDKNFLQKAADFMGEEIEGEKILGKTGLYLSKDEEKEKRKFLWWESFWPKSRSMKTVFEKAKKGHRLSKSSFALGGAMVIHKDLFKKVSFDPWISRGEDIDYLINCKLHGFDFYVDNKFNILHLPPEKTSHTLGMRQDIFRFIYEQKKLKYVFAKSDLNYFDLEDLDPFPGRFLKGNVGSRAISLGLLTAIRDIYSGDVIDHLRLVRTVIFDANQYAKKNRFRWIGFQKLWPDFMNKVSDFDSSQILTEIRR